MSTGPAMLLNRLAASLRARPQPGAEGAQRGLPLRYGALVLSGCLFTLGSTRLMGSLPLSLRGLLTVAMTAGGILCAIAASLPADPTEPMQRRWAKVRLAALLASVALLAYSLLLLAWSLPMIFGNPAVIGYETDVVAFTHVDAQLVLLGQNPYTSDSAFRAALQRYPGVLPTPLRRGVFATESTLPDPAQAAAVERTYLSSPGSAHGEFDPRTLHSYPALSFLLYLPLVWAGVGNVLILNLIAYVGLMIWLGMLAPQGGRRWAVLAAGAASMILTRSLLGDTEVICTALLLLAWHYRRHPWRGAVLLGLACAFKQYCWFFVPFYALDMFAEQGWRDAAQRAAIGLAAFLLPNLPFLLANPYAWWSSLWLPMSSAMFPSGIGLVLLAIDHVIPAAPGLLYTVAEAAALLGCLWIAARYRSKLGSGVLVLALVPLFFAFRSYPTYFAFAPWLALYAVNELSTRALAARLPAQPAAKTAVAGQPVVATLR